MELRRANANVIAQNSTSLSFFASEAMVERDRILLGLCGVHEDEVSRFNRSSTAVKHDLFKQGNKARDLIRKAIPLLAAKNRVALHIDHHAIHHLTNVEEPEAFGAGLMLSGSDDLRHSFMCAYEPVPNTRLSVTVPAVKQIAKEGSHRFLKRALRFHFKLILTRWRYFWTYVRPRRPPSAFDPRKGLWFSRCSRKGPYSCYQWSKTFVFRRCAYSQGIS